LIRTQADPNHRITVGTLDSSFGAFLAKYSDRQFGMLPQQLLFGHNHPSGDPTPSQEKFICRSPIDLTGSGEA